MIPVLTVAEMQNIDKEACANNMGETYMARAAAGLYELITGLESQQNRNRAAKVLIAAGKGNNGGDGLVLAEMLTKASYEVLVIRADTEVDQTEFLEFGADYIVDALLGTGVEGEPRGMYAELINWINAYKQIKPETIVISVDMPSGINSDTGTSSICCVQADHTVAMGFPKLGYAFYPARAKLGRMHIKDLDYPAEIVASKHEEQIYMPSIEQLSALLPNRIADGSKFDHGVALLVAGSEEMPGAAILAAQTALRSGLGYLHLATSKSSQTTINISSPETVVHALEDYSYADDRENLSKILDLVDKRKPQAICIGPGMSTKSSASKLVLNLVAELAKHKNKSKVILDADGINAFADDVTKLANLDLDILISPHAGEFSRLFKQDISGLEAQGKIRVLKQTAADFGINILYKGSPSILVNAKQAYILPYGNTALAKAGSGDVLSGLTLSFAAQGLSTYNAAILSCYVHGKAAEILSYQLSEYSVLASDLNTAIAKVLLELQNFTRITC